MKILLALFMGVATIGLLAGCGSQPASKYDALATCMTANGAKMYGTEWCPHCKDQKEMFGSSFSKIDYIDCDKNNSTCMEAGVTGYPTWIYADGSKTPGTQSLQKLAEKTNCELPSDETN